MEQQIQTEQDVTDLISKIKNPQRKLPVCVVSIALSEQQPGFDVDNLLEEAGKVAEFFVIKTGDLTRQFMASMPVDTQVYGGAARVYPVDFAARKAASALRYPVPAAQLKKATDALLRDIWAYANEAGLIAKPALGLKPELVTVKMIFDGSTALLERKNGDLISIRSETVFPGISLDRVLTVGQQVEGIYDPSNKAFAFPSQNPTLGDMVHHFGFNTVTLGLVRSAERQVATIALHPNLTLEITQKEVSGNPKDLLEKVFSPGQVYPFRLYKDPQGRTRLRCDDIDDDEPLAPALALLPGGFPWLEEGIGVVAEDEPVVADEVVTTELELASEEDIEQELATAAEATIAKASKEDQKLLRDNAFLINYYKSQEKLAAKKIAEANAAAQGAKDEADAIAADRNELSKQHAALQERHREQGLELSELKKEKRAAAQRNDRDPWSSRGQFDSAAEWLEEELRRHWIDTYKAADRKKYDMTAVKWSFGERFFDDFTEANFDATKLRKIIRTIVELVSNRNALDKATTEAHPLSDDFKGQVRREGAGANRMYVEENTPQAMRLHFWKLDGGGYELDGIELHDTFKMRG